MTRLKFGLFGRLIFPYISNLMPTDGSYPYMEKFMPSKSRKLTTSQCHEWEYDKNVIHYVMDLGTYFWISGHRNSIECNSHGNIMFSILKYEGVDFNYTSSDILNFGLNGITCLALVLIIFICMHGAL